MFFSCQRIVEKTSDRTMRAMLYSLSFVHFALPMVVLFVFVFSLLFIVVAVAVDNTNVEYILDVNTFEICNIHKKGEQVEAYLYSIRRMPGCVRVRFVYYNITSNLFN